MTRDLTRLWPVLAFGVIVLASNVLVQYPVHVWGLDQMLTYGAFSYPVAFLVTDLTNRHYGAHRTRVIVAAGFVLAVLASLVFATPRIALASGLAFLLANLLDVQIFDRLRASHWAVPPLLSSLLSSALDTALFFSVAFAGVESMSAPVPLAGTSAPLWASLAVFDYVVKVLMAVAMVAPYGAVRAVLKPAVRTC